MIARIIVVTMAVVAVSTGTVAAQQSLEPLSVWGVNQDASYYDAKEIAVSGYVVDSHIEWYGSSGSDYMTWNLLIADVQYPDESNHVLLCYESGFNIDRIRECSEIADIQKELERMVTVVGEYDARKGILNLRKFMYFERGEPLELDTDVQDHEHIRVYRTYRDSFDYDIHYTVWYRHSYIWPHPVWWLWWEPLYVVRRPSYYVYYHTPWRTYRRRVHPRPGIARGMHDVMRPDYRGRPVPRSTHGIERRTPVRPRSPESERVRVAPPARRSDTGRVAPSRVREGPGRSSPPERTRPPDRRSSGRERQEGGPVRQGPTEAPTRIRSAPPSRSGSSSGGTSHRSTRGVSPPRSPSSVARSGGFRGSSSGTRSGGLRSSSEMRSSGLRSRR